MKQEKIKELFAQGIDCSQVVTGAFAEPLGMEQDMMRKVASCFGGGMQCAETCGAVTGALMVIGLKYGHCKEGDNQQKQIMAEKTAEFREKFAQKYPSCICKELLGYDISQPDQMKMVLDKGLLFDFCPCVVADAIEILEQIL